MRQSDSSICFSPRREDSGVSYETRPDSDSSQASGYTSRPRTVDQKKLHKSSSVSTTARGVAGVFITCFIPGKGAAHKESISQPDNFSCISTSSTSVLSISSHSKSQKSGSFGANGPKKETGKFSFAEICKSTGNFSEENMIGQGGFGTVYKGKLKDGSLIAVKRAEKKASHKHMSVEFKNEIETLSKVEHLNLVRFLGFLEHDDERLAIIEYVGNGNLREHLDGTRGDGLEIAERLDVAIDVAHAITYLHMYTDHPIIHRDIKASNILLTENLRAKVTDFGLARLAPEDPNVTHISTQIKGTAGYVDPEYVRTYQLTDKSDVYSFGVLLVELVSGRRPLEPQRSQRDRITVRWAMQKYKQGEVVLAMDTRLRRNPAAIMVVERMLGLARHCLASSRRSRPSMRKCGEILWGIRKDYREMLPVSATPASSDRRGDGSSGSRPATQ